MSDTTATRLEDLPPAELRALAEQSNAWPFEQAKAIVARLKKSPKDEVLFETGYGPSGLPHIGTFGEVARTTMVRHAFRVLTEDKVKTKLLAFSDDMDGLRKVPDNVPNKEMLTRDLHKPLTQVRDPFGTHPSFGEHNNARLRAFLDAFGFEYEFASSTQYYKSGRFDATLLKMLENIDKVMAIMLPSLREERAASYSPFLPLCPRTGIVLQVPIVAHDVKAGTVSYDDPDTRERVTVPVTGGHCKLQWKPDWAMRWVALGVDYEMAGKDLIDSVKLSGKICSALGGTPPEGFNYELFLDDKGQKISKSKGNGLTIDEWLRYASPESLSLFMYREPKAAKRLYFDVIPRNVDEYQQFLDGYPRQDGKQRLSNPVWHVHAGKPPQADMPVTFQLLLTLVSSSNAENAETLWGFIGRYRPGVTPQTHPKLDALVGYAINYYRDFVAPTKKFREPNESERVALKDLRDALVEMPSHVTPERIQEVLYDIGRRPPYLDDKKIGKDGKRGVSQSWFNMLYQVLLGQNEGPRFGSFVALYGIRNIFGLIDQALARLRPPTIIFACDESGAKGYADQTEKFPGEVGVMAGILFPEERLQEVSKSLEVISDRFRPSVGKLHISGLQKDEQEALRHEIFAIIREFRLPCFWNAIHVDGLHEWHATGKAHQKIQRLNAVQARSFKEPRVKLGSSRDNPQSMHVELFAGLYTNLIAFIEERLKTEVDIEIRSDQIDSPILEKFESFAERLLALTVRTQSVTGFDTATKQLMHGEIRIEIKIPDSLQVQTSVRSLTIRSISEADGLVLAADVLAHSLNDLFKNRRINERYGSLNTLDAVAMHPLIQNLDSFESWTAADFVSDMLFKHPKAKQ